MREVIPECLNRRNEALNFLIEDITTAMPVFMGNSCIACSSGTPGGGGCGASGGGGGARGGSGRGASGGGGSGTSGGGGSGARGGGCSSSSIGGGGGASGGGSGGASGRGGCGASGGGGSGARGGGCSGSGMGGCSCARGGGGGKAGGAGGVCSSAATASQPAEDSQVSSKLMSDFWKILQSGIDCKLTRAVQEKMCLDTCTAKCRSSGSDKTLNRKSSSTGGGSSWTKVKEGELQRVKTESQPPSRESSARQSKKHDCGPICGNKGKDVALRKVLCNLKEAASFEKKCSVRLSELLLTQKDLTKQINNLEEKEKKGVGLMKQADCMWSCMEDSYKKKLAESQGRYQDLQKQLKEVEVSANKWRKTKKDLEFQMKNLNKCSQEINEKKIQKANDLKLMELEIQGFKKRIASTEKDIIATKNSYASKKNASEKKLEKIAAEIEKIQNKIGSECKCKTDKENEGNNFVKEARDELQKICRGLLQKKLENEDLRAEKEALVLEIGLLKSTYDNCAKRCARREKNIADETKRIDKEISGYTAKCVKCHKNTDSADIMGFCVDCPKCLTQRDCLNEGDHCSTDRTKVCVCTRIKEKFLDNVFENMYTVLERQVKTCPGKEVADCVLNCLKNSRNGKLDEATRKILQEFILSTVKKNLNLTIVGGAVKTRCEMDPDTYRQLMFCLKDVAVTKPMKEDKSTPAKKPPCSRWHASNECNCPKGPKSCPCTKKAAKPPTYPGSCGQPDTEATVDSSVKICPQSESAACGVDCGMLGLPGAAEWKREPCGGQSCSFTANMRAAQCGLGPEVLAGVRASRPTPPVATCISGGKAVKSCHTVTKLLKGDVKDNFNEGTRADYQKTTNENLQLELSLSDAVPTQASLKPISSLQKAILITDEHQENILKEFTNNNLDQNDTKEPFLIAFKNEIGQLNQQFTELTQTPSGKLAIALDEQTIKIVGEKSVTDPYLFISIKTTTSGHVLVDFDTKENINDKTHKVTVRRTSSGTKLLDIHKNMIKVLKDTLSNKVKSAGLTKSIKLPSSPKRSESPIDADTELPHLLMSDKDLLLKGNTGTTYSDPDLPLKHVTGPKTTDNHLEHISSPILLEIYMKHKRNKELKCNCPETTPDSDSCKLTSDTVLMLKNKKKNIPACSCEKSNSSLVSCKIITEFDSSQELEEQFISSWTDSKSVDNSNYSSEFKQLYKQGNANVAVEIQGENGVVQKLLTVETKTERGIIAIYSRGMSSSQKISFDGKECPVLLSKTVSGTYFVRIANNGQNFNATLRKTPSEGILLIPQSFQEKYRNGHEDENFFKVKLYVMRNQLLELPAVLQPTSSKNDLVVLDKEFEKCYKETLKEYFGDNLEGSVDLRTTSSGNYVLELGNEDESDFGKKNAMLVKTSSGHIKVLVHGPEFESIDKRKLSIGSTSSAQALGQTNSKLLGSSRQFHRENLTISKTLDNQGSSKTQSLVKLKEKLQDSSSSHRLLPEPPIALKKTPSGQYAILLNEESKKSLLNNLGSNSLTNNKEGLVPIKQLNSGEIIINLNNKDEEKVHHGTLKVTSSGTFSVVVDEKVMKDLTKISTNNEEPCSAVGKRSIHATQLINSVHKAVATTCQGKSDDCCCDPYTCVCVDRPLDSKDGSNDKLAQLCPCVWKEASAGGVPISIPTTSRDDSDRIVFKPSSNSTASKKEFESTEQPFYWFNSCYPYHQLRNDGVSNMLLEKSEFCQPHKNQPEFQANSEEPAEQNACEIWDALDYLPPQLPYFLKDFRYR